jgi:hypothetical protein
MGCDIHICRERKVNGQWLSLEQWEREEVEGETKIYVNWRSQQEFRDRNYDLFGALCNGVRREFDFSFAPRGEPIDSSPETREAIEGYGEDGHSHSFLYLHELRDLAAYLDTHTMPIRGMKDRAELAKLRESIASGRPNWDLLYPYCAAAWGGDHEEFNIDVPASFGIGESLAKIIDSFSGIEGAPHELRMVFFFDN